MAVLYMGRSSGARRGGVRGHKDDGSPGPRGVGVDMAAMLGVRERVTGGCVLLCVLHTLLGQLDLQTRDYEWREMQC